MKKYLIAFLLSLSCACAVTAVGCGKSKGNNSDESSASEMPAGSVSVHFVEGEGYTFESEVKNGSTVESGSSVTFTVDVSAFYTGSPVVYINDLAIAPVSGTTYSVVANEDLQIRVTGIKKDVSQMPGSGAMTDPFLVTKPVDLLYIAEQVNAGVYRYVTGAYLLAADIDCKGGELEVIGNLATENSYFSGCFVCTYDENGAYDYKISNFVINSEDTNYVGLFGAVYANAAVESSGLFHSIVLDNFTINAGLNESQKDSKSLSVGSLVGYGVGTTIFTCSATNGTINLLADESYFSFAGGLIGYQQGYYASDYGTHFSSEIAFSHTDVDVNVLSGMALAAGGISGYMSTNYPFASAAIVHHSYSHGDVSGALYSGGVAGYLGQYTAISTSYSTGEIVAKSEQSVSNPLASSDEYCYSYAGGLVGFAENDTAITECFTDSKTYAYAASGKAYATANPLVGGGREEGYSSVSSNAYSIQNCITNPDLNDIDYITEKIGWPTYDWIFNMGQYPVFNFTDETPEVHLYLNIHYVAKDGEGNFVPVKVDGKEVNEIEYFSNLGQSGMYSTFGEWLFSSSGIPRFDASDDGKRSYGYFFDADCTQRIPYGYFPTLTTDIYFAFADPTPILGTYYVYNDENTNVTTLTLRADGIASHSDGATEQLSNYFFDGERLYIESARLSRFYLGAVDYDANAAETDTSKVYDAYFDLYRYSYYDFVAELTEDGLAAYDGVYFTKDAPLYLSKEVLRGEYYTKDNNQVRYFSFYGKSAMVETVTNGESDKVVYDVVTINGEEIALSQSNGNASLTIKKSDLEAYDAFKGTWTKSASSGKQFVFDGIGNFQYLDVVYERGYYTYTELLKDSFQGTYEAHGNGIRFTMNGVTYTAEFDANGALQIVTDKTSHAYYRSQSYVGVWSNTTFALELLGIGENGVGKAAVIYADGSAYELVYEASETKDYVALYYADDTYVKNAFFGYFTYDLTTNTLTATLQDGTQASGYSTLSLFLTDDYNGEWICNADELMGVEFEFNGFGLYGHLHLGYEGTLIVIDGDTRTELTYTLDSSLQGKFAYNGKMYYMSYDEDLKVVVLEGGDEFQRKDGFNSVDYMDAQGNSYVFDGKSALDIGGKITVTNDDGETTYGYKVNGDRFDVTDPTTSKVIGSLVKEDNHYALTVNDKKSELYIRNPFIGEWAVSGEFAKLVISYTDLNGVIQGSFHGVETEITYADADTLTFRYKDLDANEPRVYYARMYDENTILLAQNYDFSDYQVCSQANVLFGSWSLTTTDQFGRNTTTTISFDGISSIYAQGIATLVQTQLIGNDSHTTTTNYYYLVKENGIVMWTQEPDGSNKTLYYKLEIVDKATANAYVQGDRAILRTQVDGLYLTVAKDANGTEYVFDGGYKDGKGSQPATPGKLLVNNEAVYSYLIKVYNGNSTVTLELVDLATNKKYSATLNYADPANATLTIGEEITE